MSDPQASSRDTPWPVAGLSNRLRDYLDRLGEVWIEGEITQWGVSGGNVYGKLKDLNEDVTVSFNIWANVRSRLSKTLAQGDHVAARVKVNFWVKGGSLSMNVLDMRAVGLGELLERIERLRTQLKAEGLFDASRKKPLPFLPSMIGLITGADSDAEKDVLRNAQLRWPEVRFRTVHAAVQGERTVSTVVDALRILDADPEVDVIIIARGGGDFQNLLGFSDERIVRAVAAAETPVVSAIGHEADRPLLDDVADLRASTPTDAAKRVVPDVADELLRIEQARVRIRTQLDQLVRTEWQRIEQYRSRPVLARPEAIIDPHAEELTRVVQRGHDVLERTIERALASIAELKAAVVQLSPLGVLQRGYAVVSNEHGLVVRSSEQLRPGSIASVRLAAGSAAVSIDSVEHDGEDGDRDRVRAGRDKTPDHGPQNEDAL